MQFIPIVGHIGIKTTKEALKLVSNSYDGKATIAEWSVLTEAYERFLMSG